MVRTTIACILFVSFSAAAFAQQNNNLFPGDPGQTLVESTSGLIDGTQRIAENSAQQVNQAAQQTLTTAKGAAQGATDSLSSIAEPPQSTVGSIVNPTSMIARWNQSTKELFNKTKKTFSTSAFDPPKMSLPRPKGRVRKFFGEFTSRSSTPGAKNRKFLPSIFPKRQEVPAKPQTIQDFLGLDRPE